MIKFRNIATAFLINDNDFLLMKRDDKSEIMPGFWGGVGGHLECDEINNPRHACIREIYEETGIKENQIIDLKLKYVIMRRWYDEVVINYTYFGKTTSRDLVENDEGTLHWVNKESLLSRSFLDATYLNLAHYLEFGHSIINVLVGVVTSDEKNKTLVKWNVLHDMKDKVTIPEL